MRRPALFLDRDGVINADHGYVHDIAAFAFVPGIFDLARFAARDLGWPLVVVTNQSGIGRGLFDEAAYERLTAWMRERFAQAGAPLAAVYHCPYHPEHGIGAYRRDHPWRKPHPGMILQAAADLDLDLAASALIGDGERDMQAGAAAGVGLMIRVAPAPPQAVGRSPEGEAAYRWAQDLPGALSLLREAVGRPGEPSP